MDVPLRNSNFMLGLPEFAHECFDKDVNVYSIIDLRTSILEHTNEIFPALNNDIPLFDDENNDESLSDALIINNSEKLEDSKDECTTHFGESSQTNGQLSTAQLAITNAPNNNKVIATSTYYKHAPPVFEDMMSSFKTKKQFEEVVKMMETQHYRNVSGNGFYYIITQQKYLCVWKK